MHKDSQKNETPEKLWFSGVSFWLIGPYRCPSSHLQI